MKKNNLIYWISTSLIALMMLFSAYNYFTNEDMKAAFIHLGFPSYFRIELAIMKIIGAGILVIPGISKLIKQLAYFGFALTFVSAIIAHLASGDGLKSAIAPIVFLAILAVSYYSNQKKLAS